MSSAHSLPSWDLLRPKFQSWRANPSLFVTDVFGITPEPWQTDTLGALNGNDRIAVRSGHGVGKSALMSWAVFWWMLTRFPVKVAATAPTTHQLEDVLWGEIAKWHRAIRHPFLRQMIEVKAG